MARVHTSMTKLRQLQKAESADKSALEKKSNEVADLLAQNKIIGLNQWFAVNGMLNADQQKVWKTVLANPLRGKETLKYRIMQRIRSATHDRRIPFAPPGPVR
jgi:hypothetical protein